MQNMEMMFRLNRVTI